MGQLLQVKIQLSERCKRLNPGALKSTINEVPSSQYRPMSYSRFATGVSCGLSVMSSCGVLRLCSRPNAGHGYNVDLRTNQRVNCGPNLQNRSAVYLLVGPQVCIIVVKEINKIWKNCVACWQFF